MLGFKRNQRLGFSCLKILILIFSLLPEFSSALGFGQIKLFSYLNEPLDAEIELLSAQNVDPAHIIASLAPAQDFDRAELSRPFYLNDLRFKAVQENKRIIIKVTTDEPMNHPYLDFLVTISWPGGRIVKGYTLLLDPAPLGNVNKRDIQKPAQMIPKENRHAILRMHEKAAQKKLIANNLVEPKPTLAEANGVGEDGQLVRLSPDPNTDAHDYRAADRFQKLTDVATNTISRGHSQGISQELQNEVQPLEKLFDNVDRQKVAEIPPPPIPRAKPVAIDSIEDSNNNDVTDPILATENTESESTLNETRTSNKATDKESSKGLRPEKQEIQFDLPPENIKNKREILDKESIISWGNINSNTLLLLSGLSLLLIVAATVKILKRYANFDVTSENLSFRSKPSHLESLDLQRGTERNIQKNMGSAPRQKEAVSQKKTHYRKGFFLQEPASQKSPIQHQIVIDKDPMLQEELNTKLRLARQYLDIQDNQSAREVLEEIIDQGNKTAIDAAKILLSEILRPEPIST